MTKVQPIPDVFFRAPQYRPQWLVYGAGAALGIWAALLLILWNWQWTTAENASVWRSLVWLVLPFAWAVLLVFGAQLLFAISGLAALVLKLKKRGAKSLTTALTVATLALLAWSLTDAACPCERLLGWIGLGGLLVGGGLDLMIRLIASREKILDIKAGTP